MTTGIPPLDYSRDSTVVCQLVSSLAWATVAIPRWWYHLSRAIATVAIPLGYSSVFEVVLNNTRMYPRGRYARSPERRTSSANIRPKISKLSSKLSPSNVHYSFFSQCSLLVPHNPYTVPIYPPNVVQTAFCHHLSPSEQPRQFENPHKCMMVFFHPHILVAKLENTPLCCGHFLTSHTYGDFQTTEVVQMATNGDKTTF